MIIAARSPNYTKPILELIESPTQVVVRFIGRDEHITLHLQTGGVVLHTHYYPNKPVSTWDQLRVDTARSMGYSSPERHGNYVDHRPVTLKEWPEGYMLLGRHVDLASLNPRQHYFTAIDNTFLVPDDVFMLRFYLTDNDTRRAQSSFSTTTSLCTLHLEVD